MNPQARRATAATERADAEEAVSANPVQGPCAAVRAGQSQHDTFQRHLSDDFGGVISLEDFVRLCESCSSGPRRSHVRPRRAL